MIEIRNVAVIGSGLMGQGIAQVCAAAGCRVALHDVKDELLTQAIARIDFNLRMLAEAGLQQEEGIADIKSRIRTTTSLRDAVAGVDFITEAISENLKAKIELFEELERMAPRHSILASNTSMLQISDIGKALKDKSRALVTHWFNPPHLIPAVEVVKGPDTSVETVEKAVAFLSQIGKTPVRVLKEVPGHLLNRIQFAINREMLALIEAGVATPEEVDKGVSESFGLRLAASGPVKTIDINGIDLFYYGMRDLYSFLDNSTAPQDILKRKAEKGEVGRRSGKGFFEYDVSGPLTSLELERDRRLMALLKALRRKD